MLEYEKELPEFYYRLKVKAGLTGYAQVYGKYNTTPYDKLKLDLFYIENYSFLLDIKLIFMTVKIFFQKEVSEFILIIQTSYNKCKLYFYEKGYYQWTVAQDSLPAEAHFRIISGNPRQFNYR